MPKPSIGFACGLLCCRNCEYAGSEYGFKYPINPKKMVKMGPAWLTQALRAAGTISDRVTVTKIDLKTPEGAGLLSELAFIEISYKVKPSKLRGSFLSFGQAQDDETLPTTAVVKFAPMVLKIRAMVDIFELIKTEFTFYSTLMRDMMPFATPKMYYGDMNYRSNNACMVLEKVAGEFRDQLVAPATIEDARLVVRNLAKLGAKWHGPVKSNYDEVQFTPRANGPTGTIIPGEAKKAKSVLSTYPGGSGWTYEIPEAYKELFDDMVANAGHWLNFAASNPDTLGMTHGDPRLDNFYFFTGEDGERDAGMLDFQMLARSDITTDLGWFLGTSCSPEFQAKYEEELLDLYLDELAKAGGPVVKAGTEERAMWEECYSLGFMFSAFKSVIGTGSSDPKDPKAVPTMDMLMKGIMSMIVRRNTCATWVKFRNCELIAQKKHPWIAKKFGQTPEKLVVKAPMGKRAPEAKAPTGKISMV